MAKIKLKLKPGDQKPFTRGNPRQCSIATAAKREFGGSAVVNGSTARIRGRSYVLGADAQNVVADHDGGNRVGSRTITLTGPSLKTLEEQAGPAKKAAAARRQARAARKVKAAERAEAAEQARKQAAERPDPRQQARAEARERPRSAEEERTARAQARVQEAEARERLRAAQDTRPAARQDRAPHPARPAAREQARPASQPRAAEHATPAARQAARVPQARTPREQPRAIEPPKPVLRFLRNPFARPEPEAQPARAGGRR